MTEPATVDAPELAGTSWVVANYSLPSGALTNPWPGSELTLKFGTDGTVTGSTGCNEFEGPYQVEGSYDPFEEGVRDDNDGQAITIGPLAVTERACAEQTWMEQEGEYLANLNAGGRWFIARGQLILRSDNTYTEFDPA